MKRIIYLAVALLFAWLASKPEAPATPTVAPAVAPAVAPIGSPQASPASFSRVAAGDSCSIAGNCGPARSGQRQVFQGRIRERLFSGGLFARLRARRR